MGRVATPLLTFSAIFLLAFTLIPTTHSLTLIGFAGRAGLPYPEEGYEGTVYLKEALIFLNVESTWGVVGQWEPFHVIRLSHYAHYVLENTGGSTIIQVKFPIKNVWSDTLAVGRGVTFKLDGQTVNHTSVEFVKGPWPGPGTIFELYGLTIAFSAESRRVIEVQIDDHGATFATEAQYTYYMMNASRWSKPIGKFDVVFQLRGGGFVSSTIAPERLEPPTVTWSLTDAIPYQDLLIKWGITEPRPPVQEFGIMQRDPSWSFYPYLIIGIVITIIALFGARTLRKLFIS